MVARGCRPQPSSTRRNVDVAVEQLDTRSIEVFSPLLANYPAGQAVNERRRKETWNIVVNTGDIRDLNYRDIIDGAALPWKISMWGSKLDSRILTKIEKRFKSIETLEDDGILVLSQGPEFLPPERASTESSERHLELAGKLTLNVEKLRQRRYLLRFPTEAFRRLEATDTFLSKRAGIRPKTERLQTTTRHRGRVAQFRCLYGGVSRYTVTSDRYYRAEWQQSFPQGSGVCI